MPARAQQPAPLTRAAAVAAALGHSPTLAAAAADTAAAAATLETARLFDDPVATASYSKDYPRYHLLLEYPLDFLWVRGSEIGSAQATRRAAQYRFAAARAGVVLAADTAYTRAAAARAHYSLARRNARDADSLRLIAAARRAAGDASDLDVDLATVAAGQQENIAAADSADYVSAVLDLQLTIGDSAAVWRVEPVDSLVAPTAAIIPGPPPGNTFAVAGAAADLEAAQLALRVQHRGVFGVPSLTFGFDVGNPANDQHGLLPTAGIAIPLPFFNRNRGPIAQATAAQQKAAAELDLARRESAAAIARAERNAAAARSRLARDSLLVTSADRVATLSLRAYREGALPLANVLEAQRTAREVLAQDIDDVAALLVAQAMLHALMLTPGPGGQP